MRRPDLLQANIGIFREKNGALLTSHQQLTSELEKTLGLIDELITLDEEKKATATTPSSTHRSLSS